MKHDQMFWCTDGSIKISRSRKGERRCFIIYIYFLVFSGIEWLNLLLREIRGEKLFSVSMEWGEMGSEHEVW